MTKEMFLNALKNALHTLTPEEQEGAVTYFDEVLEDLMQEEGLTQEAAVARMDKISTIAERILEDRPAGAPETTPTNDDEGLPGLKEITARPQAVKHVNIRARNMRIIVRAGNTEEIILRYPEENDTKFDFSLENGLLSLVQRPSDILNLFAFRIFYRQPYEIELTVPSDFAAAADIKTANSPIRIDGIAFWGALTAATSNGNIKVENVSAQDMQITTSNASLVVTNVASRSDIVLKSSNGRVTATHAESEKTLRITTSNSHIECAKCRAVDFTFATSNARISAVLPDQMTDYAVTSRTSNGSNSLPTQYDGGPKRLQATTSNGSIDIQFEG